MLSTLRRRLSLLGRTLVAAGILGTFTVAVAVVVATFGGLLGVIVVGYLGQGVELLASAPRLSRLLPVAPGAVALGSLLGVVAVGGGWLWADADTDDQLAGRFPRIEAVVLVVFFACLYATLVEGSAALMRLAAAAKLQLGGGVVVLGGSGLLAVWATVAAARREVGRLRERLLADSEPAADSHPDLAETTTRLAQQADVQPPTLRITPADRPESFALGSGADAVVVVSTGLLSALSEGETTAVIAHEISHLANADSRLMDAVLVPVLMADELLDDEPDDAGDYVLNAAIVALKLYGQFGVAILSRGREWTADAGAVALTGSPAALASALSTLSEQRQTPSTDLREWEQSVAALDILPPGDREQATGPFRTHPPTDRRIERLRQRVAAAEGE